MADRRGISADRCWRAAGIGALILAAVVVMGTLAVAHGRHEEPMPIVSSAPLGNQKPKKVVVIGDSFTEGTPLGGVGATKSWYGLVFRQLRKEGVNITAEISREGGSGYVARGYRGTTFGEKARSLLEPDDDLVIIFGATGDAREKPESVAAAVSDTFSLVRRVSPRAKLIAVAPASSAADPGPEVTRVRDIVRDEAGKFDAIFVDPIADQWFVGGPNPIRDLIREDGLHPTDVGHAYMAKRLLPIIQGVLAR
jgi:lysophospholipase L1-like esterase